MDDENVIHIKMDYYSAAKKHNIMAFSERQIDLRNITNSEKKPSCLHSSVDLAYNVLMPICKCLQCEYQITFRKEKQRGFLVMWKDEM